MEKHSNIPKLMIMLREYSQYISHPFNMAKEYLVNSEGDYMEIGEDCFYNTKNNHFYQLSEDGKSTLIKDKDYIRTYGISLHNVIVLLEKLDCKIVNILRSEEYMWIDNHYKIFFTYKTMINKTLTFNFTERRGINEFVTSDLCYYLLDLHESKQKQN